MDSFWIMNWYELLWIHIEFPRNLCMSVLCTWSCATRSELRPPSKSHLFLANSVRSGHICCQVSLIYCVFCTGKTSNKIRKDNMSWGTAGSNHSTFSTLLQELFQLCIKRFWYAPRENSRVAVWGGDLICCAAVSCKQRAWQMRTLKCLQVIDSLIFPLLDRNMHVQTIYW